jgi:pseudoazurin
MLWSVAASLFTVSTAQADPQLHEVKMWSDGGIKYFMPELLHVKTGDTVRFRNLSGHHNSESLEGLIPEGASHWISALDETYDVQITHPGVYGYICAPHYEKGMVGVIVADQDLHNLESLTSADHPKEAQKIFGRITAKLTK